MGLFDYEQEYFEDEGLKNAELVNRESLERLHEKNRANEALHKIFYLGVALVLFGIAALICFSVFFNLKTIEVSGNERYTDEEIIRASGLSLGSNLILLNSKTAANSISDAFPYINGVTVTRDWPTGIRIAITEDDAMWYSNIWGEWFILSGELRAMERLQTVDPAEMEARNLKRIKLPEIDRIVTGETVVMNKSTALDYTLDFLKDLRSQDLFTSLEYIDCSDRYHIAIYYNQSRFQIILGESKNIEAKLKLVNTIMESGATTILPTDIISFDAEYISPVIFRKQNDIFVYE